MNEHKVQVSPAGVHQAALDLAARWTRVPIKFVYGIPRGGLMPAGIVATALNVPMICDPPTRNTHEVLVVDDLVDSGQTLKRFESMGLNVDACFRKPWSPR